MALLRTFTPFYDINRMVYRVILGALKINVILLIE
jgi:hypothetical protein